MTDSPTDEPAAVRRRLDDALSAGARELGCLLDGELVRGWGDRSASCRGTRDGQTVWVRAVTEAAEWLPDPFWTGNLDANQITGLPKPHVIAWTETREPDRWFRIEVSTYIPYAIASPHSDACVAPDVDNTWLTQLRETLDDLATVQTSRTTIDREAVEPNLTQQFGITAGEHIPAIWTTAHGDLHWANLTAPELTILDWENWGTAPAGYDAATLYIHSLLVPDLADRVHVTFADILDTPDGHLSILLASARILRRAHALGDYPDLAPQARRVGFAALTDLWQ